MHLLPFVGDKDGDDMNKTEIKQDIDAIINYRNGLNSTDQGAFDNMLKHAKEHAKQGGQSNLSMMETMLIGIVLEQQKELHQLKQLMLY